jgi:hypothetical protein
MEAALIDEEALVREVANCLRSGFDHSKRQVTDAAILGFGVLTDDTGIMFTPVMGVDRGQYAHLSPEDVQFLPTYWDMGVPDALVAQGSRCLLDLYESCSDDNDAEWHEQFRSRVYQLLVRSLESLRADGCFERPGLEPPFVIAWVVDSEVPGIRARSWSKRLNPAEMHQKFVDWMDRRWGHV